MHMDLIIDLSSNLLLMFAMILLGYIAKLKKESLDDIAKIVVDYAIPALILYSFIIGFDISLLKDMYIALIFSAVIIFIGYVICYLAIRIIKLEQGKRAEFYLTGAYGNTGFIGIPVALAIFGGQGALLASVIDFGHTFILFTLGIAIMLGGRSNRDDLLRNMISPPIIALFVGLGISLLNIDLPKLAVDGIRMVSGMATPLAMLFVGGLLSQIKGKIKLWDKRIISVIAIKLFILPLCILFLLKLLGYNELLSGVILLEAATPSMVGAPLLYQRYVGNADFSASVVFITTFLCIVTIPFILFLL